MHRTTIMLPRALKENAVREARSRGVSLGELIREALASLLRAEHDGVGKDPLMVDTVLYEGPAPADTASRHDDLLYGPSDRK